MNIDSFKIIKVLGDTSLFSENAKVKCVSDYENTWGNCDPIKENIVVGETYTIERVEVHSWHTKVWLKEVPNKVFNSVHFEEDKP